MDHTSNPGENPKPMNYTTRSKLLHTGISKFINKRALIHPQKNFTAQLNEAEQRANHRNMSTTSDMPNTSSKPGEHFEPRQTATSEDYTPDPSKSISLSPPRQRLVDDIIALYSCEPTIERVKRYTADCVYDDQFVYANDRYKMAGQWFALPKLFNASVNEGYQVIRSDDEMIQFKNKQVSRLVFPSMPTSSFGNIVN